MMDTATRSWLLAQLGTSTDTADLEARYERLGTARATALEVLYERRAALVDQPTVVGVSAVVNINTTANLAALERQIAALEAWETPAPGEPGYGQPPGSDGAGVGVTYLVERRRR